MKCKFQVEHSSGQVEHRGGNTSLVTKPLCVVLANIFAEAGGRVWTIEVRLLVTMLRW